MEAGGEAGHLDLVLGEAEAPGGASRQLGDPLRMAPRVSVAGVDGPREAGRRAEARSPIGPAREPLQLGELDHVRPVGACLVLAVLLRPVERAIGKSDQLVALGSVLRRSCDTRAHCHRANLVECEPADPLDDGTGCGARALLVVSRQ